MIQPLRKRHLYMWLVLAVLLPLGFGAAYLAIPEKQSPVGSFINGQPDAFPLTQLSKELEAITIRLRAKPSVIEKQLELILKKPLNTPSAVVYLAPQAFESPDEGLLLVSLGSEGVYRIQLDSSLSTYKAYHLLFYDKIKDKVIFTTKLGVGNGKAGAGNTDTSDNETIKQ